MKIKKSDICVAILLFIVSLAVRCVGINHGYIWDEMYWVSLAQEVMKEPTAPEVPQRLTGSPLFCYLLAGWWLLFGESPFSSRILVALIGSLTIVITYFLGSYSYGRKIGGSASLFLLFSPVHWTLSRMVMADIPLLFAFLSSLAFYFHGTKKEKPWQILMGGVLGGVAALTKFSGLVLVGVFGLYALTLILRRRRFNLWAAVASMVIPLIMVIPWIQYYGSGFSCAWTRVLGEGAYHPKYVTFENLVLHLLAAALPLSLVMFFEIKKNAVDRRRRMCYIGVGILFLLLVLLEVLVGCDGHELIVHGVLVKIVLSLLSSELATFAKIGMIIGGILVLLGTLWIYDEGSEHGIFLISVMIPYLIFISVLRRRYPRYLLTLMPIFLLASAASIWRMADDKNSERIAVIYIAFCIVCFFVVGFFSLTRLVSSSTPV